MSYVHSFSVMPHLMRLHALFWIPRSSRGQGMVNNRTFITPASLVTDCFGADPPSGWVPRPRNDKKRVTVIEYSRITPFLKHPVLKTKIKKAGEENLPPRLILKSALPYLLIPIASSRAILSSMGGCVEKSFRRDFPLKGFTMNMCAVASFAPCIGSLLL